MSLHSTQDFLSLLFCQFGRTLGARSRVPAARAFRARLIPRAGRAEIWYPKMSVRRVEPTFPRQAAETLRADGGVNSSLFYFMLVV